MDNRPDLGEMANYGICWHGANKRAVIHTKSCWHWVNAHASPRTIHPREEPVSASEVYEAPPEDAPTGYFSTISVVREIIRGYGWEAIDDGCLYFRE